MANEARRGLAPAHPSAGGFSTLLRIAILLLLVVAPLAEGWTGYPLHDTVFLVVALSLGGLSWARGHWARAHGEAIPHVPGAKLLWLFHGLVVAQLLPLPPFLLRVVGPGSFRFYSDPLLQPLKAWRPISVSPADTVTGLWFLGGVSLLYGAVFREFLEERWRRRLAWAVVGTGVVLTLEALIQSSSSEPTKIWGVLALTWDWAVFGAYSNRNHFAGYMILAIPLSLALIAQGAQDLRRSWTHRRVGWLALGEREAALLLWTLGLAMVLAVGLFATQSRGGLMAFVLSAAALPFAVRHRLQAAILVTLVAASGLAWIDLSGVAHGFETRGIGASRVPLWTDIVRVLEPRFALLGAGFNAFGPAYRPYQTYWLDVYVGQAHNEYLQAFVETGIVGATIAAAFLVRLLWTAARVARTSFLNAGLFASVLGSAFHALVDFDWEIPANATAFVALAGLAAGATWAAERGSKRPVRALRHHLF